MTFDILLSPPDVSAVEEQYLVAALRSGWVAPAGPDLTAFESEVAARVGVLHAVGLSSGTSALHLALVSWGVGPGDTVIVPTFTFAATANAVAYVGATPWFVDCDETTGNLDPDLLARALEMLTARGASVPVVVVVDMLGKCADHDAVAEVCTAFGVRILSDAAESLGATDAQGRSAGSHGHAAALSFNGNKVMTTSGGGMLLTSDEDLASHVRKLSTQAREPVVHYEHEEIGYNYRLSNLLAAVGRGQLTRLDGMIARRRMWRRGYLDSVVDVPGVEVFGGLGERDNCWLTAVILDPSDAPVSAADLRAAFADRGIETRPLWKPMHRQPVFSGAGATISGASERLFARGLTLPSGSAMSEDQFARVQSVLRSVLGRS